MSEEFKKYIGSALDIPFEFTYVVIGMAIWLLLIIYLAETKYYIISFILIPMFFVFMLWAGWIGWKHSKKKNKVED